MMRRLVARVFAASIALVMLMPVSTYAEEKRIEYVIEKGDTLWGIAKEHLGAGKLYEQIYEDNKDILSSPRLIFPGQKITFTIKRNDENPVTKEFVLSGDDYQDSRMEANSKYRIVNKTGNDNYVFLADPDEAWVDDEGLVHTGEVGYFYWWLLNEDKTAVITGYSVQIAGDYDYAIWVGEEEEYVPDNKGKVKSVISTDESVATAEIKNGKVILSGKKTGHCQIVVTFEDGTQEERTISPVLLDSKHSDELIQAYIESINN